MHRQCDLCECGLVPRDQRRPCGQSPADYYCVDCETALCVTCTMRLHGASADMLFGAWGRSKYRPGILGSEGLPPNRYHSVEPLHRRRGFVILTPALLILLGGYILSGLFNAVGPGYFTKSLCPVSATLRQGARGWTPTAYELFAKRKLEFWCHEEDAIWRLMVDVWARVIVHGNDSYVTLMAQVGEWLTVAAAIRSLLLITCLYTVLAVPVSFMERLLPRPQPSWMLGRCALRIEWMLSVCGRPPPATGIRMRRSLGCNDGCHYYLSCLFQTRYVRHFFKTGGWTICRFTLICGMLCICIRVLALDFPEHRAFLLAWADGNEILQPILQHHRDQLKLYSHDVLTIRPLLEGLPPCGVILLLTGALVYLIRKCCRRCMYRQGSWEAYYDLDFAELHPSIVARARAQ